MLKKWIGYIWIGSLILYAAAAWTKTTEEMDIRKGGDQNILNYVHNMYTAYIN